MPGTSSQKIMEKLKQASQVELNAYDLTKMLDDEMSKPVEEIDAELVREVVNTLRPEEVSADLQQQVWQRIQPKIAPRTPRSPWGLRRFGIVVAILLLLLGLLLGTASANPWMFLLKLLKHCSVLCILAVLSAGYGSFYCKC